ncbi:MAG: hypothetical protein ACPG6P_08205, partial [Akkermansiaceae bacterium]
MAQEKQIADRKKELTARIAERRESITQSRAVLKEQLQFKKQFKKQVSKLVSRKPKALFIGSVAAGLGATLLLRRSRKSSRKPKSLQGIILGWGLTLLKPAAKAFLTKKIKQYAIAKVSPQQE